jgi:hypothetical protein
MYPVWYNVIPPFVPLDPSLYPTYPTGTQGFDSSIFRNYIGYILGNVYLVLKQHVVPPTYTPYCIGNSFPTMVQLVTNMDRQHVNAPILTIVHVTTSLSTYVPRGYVHQPPNVRQLRDSLT